MNVATTLSKTRNIHHPAVMAARPTIEGGHPMIRPANQSPERGSAAEHRGWLKSIAASQDKSAFAELFEWYAPRVKSVMIRQGADQGLAEELAQETMLSVWRKSHLFDPEKAAPSTWIFTIARNLRIDRFRKENRPELDPNDPSLTPAAERPADDALEDLDRQKLVRESLQALPKEQREAVALSFIEGLSHPEIAERLGLPLGTVKSRLRLSFEKLRPMLRTLR